MKIKLKRLKLFVVLVVGILSIAGCSQGQNEGSGNTENPEELSQTVTVTFIQAGYDDKVFTVNYGESFTQIPEINGKKGYLVSWQTTDLSGLKEDVTVYAVEVPNVYTVFYELDMERATISTSSVQIAYDSAYELEIPVCAGYRFIGWEVKETGEAFPVSDTYTIDGDLTLVAQWEIDEQSSDGWLPPV